MVSHSLATRGCVFDLRSLMALVAALRPVDLPRRQRRSMCVALLTRIARARDGDWQVISALLQIKTLRQDFLHNNQTVLIRMAPGAEIVAYPHRQEEEYLVIEGEIEIGAHRLGQGDMHIAAPGSAPERIRSRRGALLTARSEIAPRGYTLA